MPNLNNQVSQSAIAFIDTQVENYQSLIAGVKPGTEVVVLDGNRDAIDQITDILALHSGGMLNANSQRKFSYDLS